MGQTLSQKEDQLTDVEDFKKLRNTEREMNERLECTKNKLYIGALNDECLPIVCAVDKFHGFLVDLNEEDVTDEEITKILERHLTTDYLGGLITLMEDVLKSMLATTITPEPTERVHVVLANKRVLRIDYCVRVVHVETDDPIKVLFYYVQVGVLDMERVRPLVLQYELFLAMDDEQRDAAADELEKKASVKLDNAVYQYYSEMKKMTKTVTQYKAGDGGRPQFSAVITEQARVTQVREIPIMNSQGATAEPMLQSRLLETEPQPQELPVVTEPEE